jgi:ATP-binding cassette subfamily B protein
VSSGKLQTDVVGRADLSTLKRIISQARPYWNRIVIVALLTGLGAPLAMLIPVPLMVAVDSVLNGQPLPSMLAPMVPDGMTESSGSLLIVTALMVVLFAVLFQLQVAGANLLRVYTGERLTLNFQAELLDQAQRLSLTYHDSKGSADSVYRVQNDAQAFQRIVIVTLPTLFTSSATVLGMLAVTAWLDWTLALVAATVSPFLLLMTNVYRKRLRSEWKKIKQIETSALNIVQEVLGALRIVKAFTQEDRERSRYVDRSAKGVEARIKVAYLESGFSFLSAIVIAIGTALVMYLGVTHVQAGIISLGELLLMMAYLAQLYQPLQSIGQMVTRLQGGLASMDRAYALLDEYPDVVERDDARPLAHAAGELEFRHVGFSYDGVDSTLDDISFAIPAGSKVGVIGRTGSGKTTLVNLMLRLFDPQTGAICLDGVDLRDYRVKDLRNQYSMVLQDTILLSTSIGENICYGRPSASEEEIEDAARFADIHRYISQLPDGYATQVGERGMRLSGGQRQRIAIARAFLKDAPILILDEPTSSVDVKTESLVIDAMNRLMADKTTLMIAHRLSTLSNCDFILEIESGRLKAMRPRVA